jgi:hypothetical protein
MAITLTTDFGGVYTGVMKGVILSIYPGAVLVDIDNSIPAGNIAYGAFVLRFASKYFPQGSIHLAVVDPEVGGSRRALAIKGEKCWLVGPDNGLLMPAAREQGNCIAYEITDHTFYTKNVSTVFHGRDVFAPAAAYLAKGKEIPGLKEITDPVDMDFGVPEIEDGKIKGKVLFVDGFGNVITNIGGEALSGLLNLGDTPVVNGVKATYVTTYCESQRGSIVLLTGSHGMAEISCNGDSASTLLGLNANDNVVISLAGGKHY